MRAAKLHWRTRPRVGGAESSRCSGGTVPHNPPMRWPEPAVRFLWFESRRGAGAATDRHYVTAARNILAPPVSKEPMKTTISLAVLVLFVARPAERAWR